jgi:hypothetical protein
MKTYFLLSYLLALSVLSLSQPYIPFPDIPASWNMLSGYIPNLTVSTSQFRQDGDTMLNERHYNKLYLGSPLNQSSQTYVGGIREDILKRIFFLPVNPWPTYLTLYHFSGGYSEQLMYTFDNLNVGMQLPINTGFTTITVWGIDSIMIGDTYRKSYLLMNPMLCGFDTWIEGIGSNKDLLSPFRRDGEFTSYMLCYEDTVLYHLYTNGYTECYYGSNVGITNLNSSEISVFPNPASDYIKLDITDESIPAELFIYDFQGVLKQKLTLFDVNNKIDIRTLGAGFHILKIIFRDGFKTMRLTKI